MRWVTGCLGVSVCCCCCSLGLELFMEDDKDDYFTIQLDAKPQLARRLRCPLIPVRLLIPLTPYVPESCNHGVYHGETGGRLPQNFGVGDANASSSVVTLARPPTRSSLKITSRSFRYASPYLCMESTSSLTSSTTS